MGLRQPETEIKDAGWSRVYTMAKTTKMTKMSRVKLRFGCREQLLSPSIRQGCEGRKTLVEGLTPGSGSLKQDSDGLTTARGRDQDAGV
jgi:hypothetical protein